MKLGGEPSGAREVYSFAIKSIGVVTEERLDQNRRIIQPRAPVYILEDEDNPMEWIVRGLNVIWTKAHIERHESWRVPVVKNFCIMLEFMVLRAVGNRGSLEIFLYPCILM